MDLNYPAVGATDISEPNWHAAPAGFCAYERSVVVGSGEATWQTARSAVLTWGIKTRSGFDVLTVDGAAAAVRAGADCTLVARLGPFSIREPARVVAVVDEDDRVGFAYGTRVGHPVSGEEAFILTRTPDGTVSLTLRSLTRPPTGSWRAAFPLVLVAQRWYRFRYLRALRRI